MLKRFGIAVVSLGFVGLLAISGIAGAQSRILCGLISGANLQFNLDVVNSCVNSSTTSNQANRYVALGDSVAAGLGLSGTYSNDDPRCGRTLQGYPNYVASGLGLPLTNLACSGATAGDLVTRQGISGPNISAQLPTAFANGTPKVLTLTTGANDAHWTDFIKACYYYDCTGAGFTYTARSYLALLSAKLNVAFAYIQAKSGTTPPKTIVTGYYNPVSSACSGKFTNITDAELTWMANETVALNQTIQNAAANYSFIKYVPISFAGHDVCSSQPWVQGVNATAPFHPTDAGQRTIAAAVLKAAQ